MSGVLSIVPREPASDGHVRAQGTPVPERTIILGMPHLAIGGISETWLLKELGHRHWMMLAEAAGRPLPDFQDRDGRAVYAAFKSVSLRGVDLAKAQENGALGIASELARLSRTQFRSLHYLSLNGEPIGTVELVSVFVKRMIAGRNRSIVRVDIPGLPPVAPGEARSLADAAMVRSDDWATHLGFVRTEGHPLFFFPVNPCPTQDFNGAGFLYCATFQAYVDRAEWEFRRDTAHLSSTVQREIVFRGNIEVGERVAVYILSTKETADGFAHWCRLLRIDDGQILADVFTQKVFSPSRGRG